MNREEAWILKEKYSGKTSDAFFADIASLASGVPLAYIIGSIPFLNTTISLSTHPLIPRAETEYWVSQAIDEMRTHNSKTLRILDLCAGSGCIGVAVLSALPNTQCDFVEIDSAHHQTILKNCELNGIAKSRFAIFGGDLFNTVPELFGTYDFILTNPPYIDKEANTVAESVTTNEPHVALFGGEEGLEIIKKIITSAHKHLNHAGVLFIEHEPSQVERIREIVHRNSFTITTHNDQYNTPRYSHLTMQQ